jgi:hypothetical protein
MNSQFSIGFVIALVIGIAVGAFWPKYGPGLTDTALGLGNDARQVSYALTNGEQDGRGRNGDCNKSSQGFANRAAGHGQSGQGQAGRGCSGNCDKSSNGSSARGAGRGQSGHGQGGCGQLSRGQGGHGQASHGQVGRGCSGDCDKSSNGFAAQGGGHGNSGQGKGVGRHGRTSFASVVSEGSHERLGKNAKFAASQTCQKSAGQGKSKNSCSGEEDCEKSPTAGGERCNASGQGHPANASESGTHNPEHSQHGHDRNIEDSVTQHRGPGLGLGLGLGPGWARDFEMAATKNVDAEALAAEKE